MWGGMGFVFVGVASFFSMDSCAVCIGVWG